MARKREEWEPWQVKYLEEHVGKQYYSEIGRAINKSADQVKYYVANHKLSGKVKRVITESDRQRLQIVYTYLTGRNLNVW